MEEIRTDDRWYIDIQGNVRPTTTKKIIDSLLSGELKVINRISRDRKTWKAICNEPFIGSTVDQLIDHYNAEARKYEDRPAEENASDNTGFHNLERISNTIEEQLKHANRLQELNGKLNALRALAAEIKDKKKIVVDISAAQKPAEEIHPDDASETVGAPSFWQTLKSSLKVENRHRFAVLLIILAGSGGYFAVDKVMTIYEQKKVEAEKALAIQALQAKSSGDYQKAISLFEQVENLDNLSPETLVAMAEANIRLSRYNVAGNLLSKARQTLPPGELRAQSSLMLGTIALRSQQTEQAAMYYTESISDGPLYPALYNLAVINLEKKNYKEAESLLLQALKFEGFDRGPTLLSLFESAWRIDENLNRDRAEMENEADRAPQFLRLQKVSALLEHANKEDHPYADELMAAQVMISAITGNHASFAAHSKQWTDFAVKEFPKKNKSPDVNYERVHWDRIYLWCAEVYKIKSLPSIKGIFFAQCSARSKTPASAIPYANYSFSNMPDDAAVRGYLAHLMYRNEQYDEARKLLRAGNLTGSLLAQNTLDAVCKKSPDSLCPEAEDGGQGAGNSTSTKK